MIHQHIFASPKPGMTEDEFHRYWLDVHAIKYVQHIKQIKSYKIDTRIDWNGERPNPVWNGIAEIWLRNEQEQIESLQSKEFLEGAKLDEPRWAAFWNTLVLDTDTHVVLPVDATQSETGVKLVVLSKRKGGVSLEDYRTHLLNVHSLLISRIPGLTGCWQCLTRDSWYGLGEPRYDSVTHLWFNSAKDMETAVASPEMEVAKADAQIFTETKYSYSMAVKEHWIIGPNPRP